MSIEGIITPLITPFTENGALDKRSLENLTEYVVSSGVNGLFTCSTTGEFLYLSPKEKIEITETVTRVVKRRVPVYAGITEKSIEETISIIKDMEGLKPEALVIAPLVYHSNRKLHQHIERISMITNLPIVLYNNDELIKPPLKKENVRTNILKRISKIEKVIGLKDSSGDMGRLKNYLRAVKSRKDFSILVGDETKILDSLKMGAVGMVPSLANLLPDYFVRLYNSFKKNSQQCCELQKKIIQLRDTIYTQRKKIRGGIKVALRIKGIIKEDTTREPNQTLTEFEKNSLGESLRI